VNNFVRILGALGAIFIVSIAIAACGGGGDSVPSGSVAKVGGTKITNDTFNHWVSVAIKGSQQPGSTTAVAVPDPPDFNQCVASKRKSLPKPPKGQTAPTDAQLKTQCKTEYTQVKDQVMQFLIAAQWVSGEAGDLGIKIKDADVQKQFELTKKQSFKKEADYQKFLTSSGMTQADIMFRVRNDVLSKRIQAKVSKSDKKITDAAITDYYNKNKSRFAQPERRDLLIVLTKTKAKAQQAKAALDSGQSFASVAKKYSIDDNSKKNGGKLQGVASGQQEKSLDDAVFGATPSKITGPVKTSFGYYVFKVTKVTSKSQQSLAQAKSTIQSLLDSQEKQKALNTFVTDFRKKWKGKTNCAKGYVVDTCKNAPKPKTTSAPAQQQTPQQTPQAPQAPQGTPTAP
jgi:foldase protein PrsA